MQNDLISDRQHGLESDNQNNSELTKVLHIAFISSLFLKGTGRYSRCSRMKVNPLRELVSQDYFFSLRSDRTLRLVCESAPNFPYQSVDNFLRY